MRILLLLALFATAAPGAAARKSVLFIAGPKSHGPGQHEHPAGCALLAAHLNASGLPLAATVSQGWPADPAALAAADAVVIYADGMGHHPARGHEAELRARAAAGKGLTVLHWALEPGDPALAKLLDELIGGHFDEDWSVNPVWKMESPTLPPHAVTRGVAAFAVEEEFYYHLRLRQDVVPVLQALPPAGSLGADGPRSANPAVRAALAAGTLQTLAWVTGPGQAARGFGFTGGHFHCHWTNANFRKLVLNGIVWTSGLEVPPGGVTSTLADPPAYPTIDDAITKNDLADVKRHLAARPESRDQGRDKTRTPLAQAVLRNRTEIAQFLLESGARTDTVDGSRRTPLHLAVERGNAALVTALLAAKADPNPGDKDGWTPLHHAAAKNRADLARLLLAGGADPKRLSALGGTALHEAAPGGGAELIAILLEKGADPAVVSKEGVTALDLAKKYNNKAAVEALGK